MQMSYPTVIKANIKQHKHVQYKSRPLTLTQPLTPTLRHMKAENISYPIQFEQYVHATGMLWNTG
jgi:hypothetical protein